MQIKPHDKGATYLIVAFLAGSLAAVRDNEAERGTHDIATMRYVACAEQSSGKGEEMT
jgi:hypothetical protein